LEVNETVCELNLSKMNSLTGIEAERVLQILRHAVDRLHLLEYVPDTWDSDLISQLSCAPVIGSLERLWDCEDQLSALIENMTPEMGGRDISLLKKV